MLIIRFLMALFTITNREIREEIQRLRFAFISIVIATLLGAAFILIVEPEVGACMWWALPLWLFSAYRLFSIQRFVRLHITGEVLEFFQALSRRIRDVAIEETGLFNNFFTNMYWRIITTAFLLQTILFLLLPLYVNYTYGGKTAAVTITMLLVVIAISSFTFFIKVFRTAVVTVVVVYVIGLIFVLFPHAGFYLRDFTKKVNIVNASTANKINELESLRSKQQEKIDNQFIEGIIAWQKKHPGQELPLEYQTRLDRARQLKLL